MMTYKKQSSIHEILEIVDQFEAFDLNRVSKILKFELLKNEDRSNNAFTFYEGKCAASNCKFNAAELRQSNHKSKIKNGHLKLTLNSIQYNFTQNQLIDELGEPEISPPDPNQLKNPTLYFSYDIEGKHYSFGFPYASNAKDELMTIIIRPN